MILLNVAGNISPIFLTVLLIVSLILAELGSKRIKKNLMPFLIVLGAVFALVVVQSIISKL